MFIMESAAQTIYAPQRELERNNRNLIKVRGKVVNNVRERTPHKSAVVELYYNIPSGRSNRWVIYQSTITDSDGFFYFKNVRPYAEAKLVVDKSRTIPFKISRVDRNRTYHDMLVVY